MDSLECSSNWLETLSPHVDRELLGDFVQECREHLQQIEGGMLLLEAEPDDVAAMQGVFRAFHTVKGTAAFLGFSRLATLAHQTESLLSRMRAGEIRCTRDYTELILRATDFFQASLQALEESLQGRPLVPPVGLEPLLEALERSLNAEPTALSAVPPPRLGDILVAEGKVARQAIESVAADSGGLLLGIALVRTGTASLPDVAQALRRQRQLSHGTLPSAPSVRVRLDHLDTLLELLGELVLAQDSVAQAMAAAPGSPGTLAPQVQQLGALVQRLHTLGLAMRLVPLSSTFQKMQRVVRDVAQRQGKCVEFSATGEDTEIDRNLVELLTDPLLHMVRNAVDHGIETPVVRACLGKPPAGRVSLKAYHQHQQVVIELHDDGQGLSCEKIVAQALKMGLIKSAAGLTEQEIYRLIFTPGFSTAPAVTDISGRGVGMDVVWQSLTAMHGEITIASQAGQGSTFVVSLPLRLAMLDALVVQVGQERYLIPAGAMLCSFQPQHEGVCDDAVQGEMLHWGERLLPLVRLHALFAVPGAQTVAAQAQAVVVCEASGQPFALLVDRLLGWQQVMLQPASPDSAPLQGCTGRTLLRDGRMALMLDLPGVLALSRRTAGPQ